jgi:hypothetical protein
LFDRCNLLTKPHDLTLPRWSLIQLLERTRDGLPPAATGAGATNGCAASLRMEPAHLAKGVHDRQLILSLARCRGGRLFRRRAGLGRGYRILCLGGVSPRFCRRVARSGLCCRRGRVALGGRWLATVVDIPAGSLEDHADVLDNPSYESAARRAFREGIVTKFLILVEAVTAVPALILIRRHLLVHQLDDIDIASCLF